MEKENEYNRRKFFKNAALASAGLAMAPSVLMASPNIENPSPRKLNSSKSAVKKRKLGSLEVSGIGLGCMSMVAGTYNPTPSKQEMIAHIRKAVERGVTFLTRRRFTDLIQVKLWWVKRLSLSKAR